MNFENLGFISGQQSVIIHQNIMNTNVYFFESGLLAFF